MGNGCQRDELKGGTGVDWCGTWAGLEITKRKRSMEYLGYYGRGYLLVRGCKF